MLELRWSLPEEMRGRKGCFVGFGCIVWHERVLVFFFNTFISKETTDINFEGTLYVGKTFVGYMLDPIP